ncbi:hypothetical protein ACP70R_030810 [Stipagrostis hirtigluma subsp. patula]
MTGVEIPEEADDEAPERKLSKKVRLLSRKDDAQSQMEFWRLNLSALQEKEAAQVAYHLALIASRDQLQNSALHQPTDLGSGYSITPSSTEAGS